MITIYIIVEGKTEYHFFEKNFLNIIKSKDNSILIDDNDIKIKCINLNGNSRFKNFESLKKKIISITKSCDIVTTVVDFFRLPLKEMEKVFISSKEIYTKFYDLFKKEANSYCFIPYLSIHEFETLIFSNIKKLKEYIKNNFKLNVNFDKYNDIEFEIKEPSYLIKTKTCDKWNKIIDFNRLFDESYVTFNDLFEQCIYFNKWVTKITKIIKLKQNNKHNTHEKEFNKLD